MEGGSPTLIWKRWTLPMYEAQLRYWGDWPRIDQMLAFAHSKRGWKPGYTPPARESGPDQPASPIDWNMLDKLEALKKRG